VVVGYGTIVVKDLTSSITTVKAEELIKSKITVEDQDQLVNEYLDKVVEQ
jgi:hypothetical protein